MAIAHDLFDDIHTMTSLVAVDKDCSETSAGIGIESDKNGKTVAYKAREAARSRVSRQRVKNTRDELRNQADELSKDLSRLKEEKEKAGTIVNRTASYLYWKTVAREHQEQRQEAEDEQRRLAASVETQAVYIQTLSGMIRKKFEAAAASDDEEVSRLVKKNRLEPTDSELCDAYIEEVDANYARVDAIFDEGGMESLVETEATVHSVHKCELTGETTYFQRLNKYTQPFVFRDTAKTMWNLGRGQCLHDHLPFGEPRDPENTIAMKFRDTNVLATGTTVSLSQRYVMRRYDEGDRIVFVWKLTAEGEEIFNGMQLEEAGWCSLRASSDVEAPGTVIEMCLRWTPMYFCHTRPSDQTIGQFCEVIQDTGDTLFDEVLSSMETMLIDAALDPLTCASV
ncbi:hypothetical protein PHYBOEH_002565 [Phytophthora boehmeriae]|uniref:M96 mating-specific protein family n=1 Tax=Phytophthora boehmeriae TaxID=109152 RepID=A0A8T1WQS8_9STRA|nr:hypothetical protein PHYBOEH_002565 [Phytophthora boehmeriae]